MHESVIEIYYFSGTGNSLHVARQLARRLPEAELIPIARLGRREAITSTADAVGLVVPIHALGLPWPVKRFLERASFKPGSYKFAVTTRECFQTVFTTMDKLLPRGERFHACFAFEMPVTYVPVFEVYSEDERARVEREMLGHVDRIATIVSRRAVHRPKDHPGWFVLSHMIYPLVRRWFQLVRFPNMERSFYANDSCTGCGTCAQVCLANKIVMRGGRPAWQPNVRCAYCLACFHYCPSHAIQISGRNTTRRGRYHHPSVSAADIAAQKRRA